MTFCTHIASAGEVRNESPSSNPQMQRLAIPTIVEEFNDGDEETAELEKVYVGDSCLSNANCGHPFNEPRYDVSQCTGPTRNVLFSGILHFAIFTAACRL